MQHRAGEQRDPATLAEDLRRVVGAFVREVRGEAGTPSSSGGETLALLADRGTMTIAALAHLRRVKHQSMRLVIAPLVEDGLVALNVDAADRRTKMVEITEAGRAALHRDRQARRVAIEGRIRDVLTDEDRSALAAAVPILERLCYGPSPGFGAERLS